MLKQLRNHQDVLSRVHENIKPAQTENNWKNKNKLGKKIMMLILYIAQIFIKIP